MKYKEVMGVQYISPYVNLAFIKREEFITSLKREMICDLLETYPSMEYRNIKFELTKPSNRELCELVESYKYIDGRYHYDGDFVSREWLEKELSQKDYKLFMRALVAEGEQQ